MENKEYIGYGVFFEYEPDEPQIKLSVSRPGGWHVVYLTEQELQVIVLKCREKGWVI